MLLMVSCGGSDVGYVVMMVNVAGEGNLGAGVMMVLTWSTFCREAKVPSPPAGHRWKQVLSDNSVSDILIDMMSIFT